GLLRALDLGQGRAELLAVRDADGVSVAIGGVDYRADVVDEAHARLRSVAGAKAASHARRELKAPMPGLLVSILCQVGDAIEPGQPLALLQAMKMENELSLPRGGTVTSISAAAAAGPRPVLRVADRRQPAAPRGRVQPCPRAVGCHHHLGRPGPDRRRSDP